MIFYEKGGGSEEGPNCTVLMKAVIAISTNNYLPVQKDIYEKVTCVEQMQREGQIWGYTCAQYFLLSKSEQSGFQLMSWPASQFFHFEVSVSFHVLFWI